MDFTVEQTARDVDQPATYTLQDAHGASLLIADQTSGPPPDARRQIRLARPSGRLVATIDIPQVVTPSVEEEQRSDYAIIHEYAVYAIISVRRRPLSDAQPEAALYFILEVEGETWLVLPHPDQADCYAFYDEVPAGLHTYDNLTEVDLPSSIGQICRSDEEHLLTISLEPVRLVHTDLVVLSLALLIAQGGKVS